MAVAPLPDLPQRPVPAALGTLMPNTPSTTPGRARELAVSVAIALGLAAWFLDHTWRGLFVMFQGDDMMNTYLAWVLPWRRLVWGNLTPFTTVYRPVGSLFYKIMYAAAGFHPLPFRIALYALMLVNIGLLYRFARQVTGSREAAVLAALLGSYHRHFIDMYENGGVVYDVLCYTFFIAAMSCYIAGRSTGALRGWRLVRFLALVLLALNSKEMAVMLAPALWAYELLYHPPSTWRPAGWWQWIKSQTLALWILTAAAPVAAWVKTGPTGPFHGVGGYEIHFNWAQWLETTHAWIEALFYLPYKSLSPNSAALCLLLPWVLAALVRDRERRKAFLWCGVLVAILPLPVNFIDTRAFFVMYLPLAAWSICAACALTGVRDWLLRNATRWLARPGSLPSERQWGPWPEVALAVFTIVGLHSVQRQDHFRGFEWIDPSQTNIRALSAGLAEFCPAIPTAGKVEILDDPFDKDTWDPTFVTRLWTRKVDVEVHRWPPASSDGPAKHYDCTLAYREGKFVRPAVPPAVVLPAVLAPASVPPK